MEQRDTWVEVYRAATPAGAELARLCLHSAGLLAVTAETAPAAQEASCLVDVRSDASRRVWVPAPEADAAGKALRGSARIIPLSGRRAALEESPASGAA